MFNFLMFFLAGEKEFNWQCFRGRHHFDESIEGHGSNNEKVFIDCQNGCGSWKFKNPRSTTKWQIGFLEDYNLLKARLWVLLAIVCFIISIMSILHQ